MKPEIYVYISFTGKFDPDEITKEYGILPSRTGRAGDVVLFPVKRKYDTWELDAPKNDSPDINYHLRVFLEYLSPLKEKIASISKRTGVIPVMQCVITVFIEQDKDKAGNNDFSVSFPASYIELDLIIKLYELGVDLDFDYILA